MFLGMNKEYYLNEYDPFPQIDETMFEDQFFSYDPDEDSNGSIGINLANIAFSKAKMEKLPIELWTAEHRMNYHSRNREEIAS